MFSSGFIALAICFALSALIAFCSTLTFFFLDQEMDSSMDRLKALVEETKIVVQEIAAMQRKYKASLENQERHDLEEKSESDLEQNIGVEMKENDPNLEYCQVSESFQEVKNEKAHLHKDFLAVQNNFSLLSPQVQRVNALAVETKFVVQKNAAMQRKYKASLENLERHYLEEKSESDLEQNLQNIGVSSITR
jgi:hypothetical protein